MPHSTRPGELSVSVVDAALRSIIEDASAPALFIPFNYSSNAAEARCFVKSGASYLYGFTVSNSNAAARFIQVFDTATFPANGAVPKLCVSVATLSDKEIQWGPPRRMDAGIILCSSTTQNTLTLGAAEFLFDVQYV